MKVEKEDRVYERLVIIDYRRQMTDKMKIHFIPIETKLARNQVGPKFYFLPLDQKLYWCINTKRIEEKIPLNRYVVKPFTSEGNMVERELALQPWLQRYLQN